MSCKKSIQIDFELFMKLYFYFEFNNIEYYDEIKILLNEKADKIILHELYSKYKNTKISDTEREKARKEYLDKIGMRNSFRW